MKKYLWVLIFTLPPIKTLYPHLIPQGFGVPFTTGMRVYKDYINQKNEFHQLLEKVYYYHIFKNLQYSFNPRIPKIIHQIWLGSPLPKKYLKWQKEWKRLHPDWIYKLWTEEDIEKFGLINKDFYDASNNYGQKSDIARYEILFRIGGVYADMDTKPRRAIDFFHHCFDFYAGIEAYGQGIPSISNAIIGSKPGHPILKECIISMKLEQRHPNPLTNVTWTTGPGHFTRCIFKKLLTGGRNVIFPTGYFSPLPHCGLRHLEEKAVCPETFIVHYWQGDWTNELRKEKKIKETSTQTTDIN